MNMAHPRIVAAGGGSAEDQRPIDRLFASWLSPSSSILYLPIAMQNPQDNFASNWAWITQTLAPFDRTRIQMWTSLAGKTAQNLMTSTQSTSAAGTPSGSSTSSAPLGCMRR